MCNMKQVKLKDITTKIGSGATPLGGKTSYKTTGIAFIRSLNIFDLNFSYDELAYITDEQANKLNNVTIEPDDILLNITGASVARCCILPKNLLPARVNQHVSIIRIKKELVNPYFVQYLLVSPYYKQKLLSIAQGGATREALTKESIENFEITIPNSKKSQDKIANILLNYDKLIENNNKRIKILEELAQKIYKEWFIDFKFPNHETTTFKDSELGKIPSDWKIKKVCEISTLSKGKSYKSSELVKENEGFPFLNLKCVERDGGFRRDGLKWFDGKYNDTHVVMPEDIIMAVTDMTQERRLVARPARIPHNWYKKYVMSMDLVKLIANNNIDKSYLYSLLKYSKFSDEVKNHANGANVLHLNPKNIEQFELVVADKTMRDSFGNIIKQIYDEIDILYLKNQTLKQTRDILLPRLISGEIDVENLNIL